MKFGSHSRLSRAESAAVGTEHRKLDHQRNQDDGEQFEIVLSSVDEDDMGREEDGRSSLVSQPGKASEENLVDELISSRRDGHDSYSSSDEDRDDSQDRNMDGDDYARPRARHLVKDG